MKAREQWYLLLFIILSILALVVVIIDERDAMAEAGTVGAIRIVWQAMAPITVVNTALSFAIVEVTAMLAEMYRRRKDRELKEALEEARAETNAQWEAWLQRKADAERRGEEFTEPSPAEKTGNSPRNGR